MKIRDEASESQVRAANPSASTWLSANAGSGKTKVLTDRVALLLLNGVAPEQILCLTYTKAAASEMQNRLFRLLGDWAMKEDKELFDQLSQIGSETPFDEVQLRHARTLFARAIETPGGLKIQTIHSFCAALLRRFPLEAGVSPDFSEMDDRSIKVLCQDILENLARSDQTGVIAKFVDFSDETTLDNVINDLLRARQDSQFKDDRDVIFNALGMRGPNDMDELVARHLREDDLALVSRIKDALRSGGKTDQSVADILSQVREVSLDGLERLQEAFLIKSQPFSIRARFPSKAVATGALAPIFDEVQDLMERVAASKQETLSLSVVEQTLALHGLAAEFLPMYEREKQVRGWLDFDDLILKTRDLLNDPRVADWVLYRLDGALSHILVDEAQDTSPLQWQVIAKLAQEITSGEGARSGEKRTLFVVGDKKQSIYSFQGADADAFDDMKNAFGDQLAHTLTPLYDRSLEYSFRSSSAILRVVDETFAGKDSSGFSLSQQHLAFKVEMPGRVDLWPFIPKISEDSDEDWSLPVDLAGRETHFVTLAGQIATMIKKMIDEKHPLPVEIERTGKFEARPVTAGDFLILVQRRSDLFHEVIQACKALNLPIAGADRLKVGAEMAVKDLIALLSFLVLPEDDLSLAVVLKSPLFGWDEQKLFSLAYGRGKRYLWQVLRDQSETYTTELTMLQDLRERADFLRPYELLERILTRHDGRKKFIARLGPEAEDGINALLGQALSYEQSEIPSLTGFILWSQSDVLEIKRQVENDGAQIRVMTVHGAKGLEAPIVILPDTAKRPLSTSDVLLNAGEVVLWTPNKDHMPQTLLALQEEKQKKELQERDRLLYVAMTRAEKWLIVAGAGETGGERPSWYEQIAEGMERAGAFDCEFEGGVGKRVSFGDWDGLHQRPEKRTAEKNTHLPDWVALGPTFPAGEEDILNPSDLGGAKAIWGQEGEDEATAMRRGTQIHLLLETLPKITPQDRKDHAELILKNKGLLQEGENIEAVINEALRVLDDDSLSFIFAPDTLAEVAISARLGPLENRLMNGIIDRLIINGKDVWVIDFKTNRSVPSDMKEVPEGILRQMGAYTAALAGLYPEHQIKPCILWTAKPLLMPLEPELAINALRSVADA